MQTIIKNPLPDILRQSKSHPPKIIHYPINLANCGTIDGNVKVLEDFCGSLGLQKIPTPSAMVFDSKIATYDLKMNNALKCNEIILF